MTCQRLPIRSLCKNSRSKPLARSTMPWARDKLTVSIAPCIRQRRIRRSRPSLILAGTSIRLGLQRRSSDSSRRTCGELADAPALHSAFTNSEDLTLFVVRWLDFRFQIRFSTTENGRIRAWLGDKQVVDYLGVNAYPENKQTGYANPSRFYFKMGLYRDVMTEPMTIYIDEYRKKQLPENGF
jgi:hypothetical protein